MNENDNNTYNDNNNKFNLKTNPIKGPNGEIIEPSVYLDSDVPRNVVEESPELTKEQLQKMKETIATEIDKTTQALSYKDLREAAIYNSSDSVREQAKEEIKRRILSGEVSFGASDESLEQTVIGVLSYIEDQRREYLQSVAKSKGNTR